MTIHATTTLIPAVPEKHAGITHIAILCDDLIGAKLALEAAGHPIRAEQRFTPTAHGIFVRDPDGVVIELHQRT